MKKLKAIRKSKRVEYEGPVHIMDLTLHGGWLLNERGVRIGSLCWNGNEDGVEHVSYSPIGIPVNLDPNIDYIKSIFFYAHEIPKIVIQGASGKVGGAGLKTVHLLRKIK